MPFRKLAIAIASIVIFAVSGAATFASGLISAQEAYAKSKANEIVLIDIRSPAEWKESGIAETAIAISMHEKGFLEGLEKVRKENPNKEIALICATGGRTHFVQNELKKRNLGSVIDVSEGMFGNKRGPGWIAQQLPIKKWSK